MKLCQMRLSGTRNCIDRRSRGIWGNGYFIRKAKRRLLGRQCALDRGFDNCMGKATIGVAAVMLIPDSADAQTVPAGDDLPQVRVTAPSVRLPEESTAGTRTRDPRRCNRPERRRRQSRSSAMGAAIAGYRTPAQPLIAIFNASPEHAADRQRRISAVDAGSADNVAPGGAANVRELHSQQEKVASKAIKSIFGDTPRETIFTEMAFAIRGGTHVMHSASIELKFTRALSSFLFGRGSTGGVINIVSKLPQNRDFYVVEGTGTRRPAAE